MLTTYEIEGLVVTHGVPRIAFLCHLLVRIRTKVTCVGCGSHRPPGWMVLMNIGYACLYVTLSLPPPAIIQPYQRSR